MDWIIVVLLLVALAAIIQLWLELAKQRKQTLSANFAVEEAQRELDRLQAAQTQTWLPPATVLGKRMSKRGRVVAPSNVQASGSAG